MEGKVALGFSPGRDPLEALNQVIKENFPDTNGISDGYHTFGELYEHRIALYIKLARTYTYGLKRQSTSPVWKSKAHSDGSVWDGWFILGIFSEPGEQITYHLPMSAWEDCEFANELHKAPEWDGHTSAEVLTRLQQL